MGKLSTVVTSLMSHLMNEPNQKWHTTLCNSETLSVTNCYVYSLNERFDFVRHKYNNYHVMSFYFPESRQKILSDFELFKQSADRIDFQSDVDITSNQGI